MSDNRLKIDVRRSRILDILHQEGKVSVARLSKELGTTTVTIRHDLDALDRNGQITRIQGGALYKSPLNLSESTSNPVKRYQEKKAIAASVSEMIHDGSTIFINSGSTTNIIVEELANHQNLNIVTTSVHIAATLGVITTFRVILLGGQINTAYGFTFGGDAQLQLERYTADFSILSVDGIDYQSGVTSYHADEAIVEQMMVRNSRSVIIAADSSKVGRTGFIHICDISPNLTLITDSGCDTASVSKMRNMGATIRIVDND